MLLLALLQASAAALPIGALAAGIVVIGAAIAIARIGASSTEAIARQPEAAGNIRTTMIIAAALVEGVALFALVICFLSL